MNVEAENAISDLTKHLILIKVCVHTQGEEHIYQVL